MIIVCSFIDNKGQYLGRTDGAKESMFQVTEKCTSAL